MSLKVNHSRDYHNFLDNVIENELKTEDKTTSESLWIKMAAQLEIEGVPAHEISTIMRKDIENRLYEKQFKEVLTREEYKWHSGHFFRVMKKHEWINPFMSRTNAIAPLGEQGDSSIYTQNNGKMLLLCDNIINICRTMKEKAKDMPDLTQIFGEKQMSEFYMQQNTMLVNCKFAIDSKTKIPPNTETILLETLATVMGNTNKAGQIFQENIMKYMKTVGTFLTQKQASKFQKGGKQSQLYLLKPTNRDFALYADYTGTQCTCGSWRVRPKTDHTTDWECYDCDKIIPKQHIPKCTNCQIPLFKERIQHIIKTGKCKNCDETIDLPQAIIDQANS